MKSLVTSTPSFVVFSDHFHYSTSSQLRFIGAQSQQKSNTFICLSSPSSPSSASVVEEVQQDTDNNSDALPFNGCKGCGREQIESGCNSEGRIQGGIATIPGFGWWPIKAYRPCPGFLASGGNYRRRGQSMDEVAFGGGRRAASMDAFDETEKRKQGKNKNQIKS